jgi:hypothetical protein
LVTDEYSNFNVFKEKVDEALKAKKQNFLLLKKMPF